MVVIRGAGTSKDALLQGNKAAAICQAVARVALVGASQCSITTVADTTTGSDPGVLILYVTWS
jgi:hypothetical protein